MMSENNRAVLIIEQKPSFGHRMAGAVVFICILIGFAVLWSSAQGHLNLRYWLGECGFKQRYGLPCPGCGWTHAGQQFVTGHFIEAFREQPAAAFFCVIAVITAVFALLYSVFGIMFSPLQRINYSKSVSITLISACCIILLGWIVTLVRAILET